MIGLGLTTAGIADLHRTLAGHHLIRTTLRVLDLAHNQLRTLTAFFEDGQVNYDGTDAATTDRSTTLTLFDPRFATGLDSRSPSDLTAGPERMLAITYSVAATRGGPWVDIPVFTGPITEVNRKGWTVNVECLGKEYLARHAMHSTKVWAKGTRKTDIILDIIVRVCGETASLVTIPTMAQRTTKATSLGSEDDPWTLAQTLAGECDQRLYYDGRGECRMMPKTPTNTVYTFRDGPGGTVLELPESGPDAFDSLTNRVRVEGSKPSYVGVAIAPASHPLNPYRLGRNGVGMAWTLSESDSDAKSKAAATKSAQAKLKPKLDVPVSANFSALPAPHLEIGDRCQLSTATAAFPFQFTSSSLPLRCDEGQTVGLTGRVSQ